MEGKHARSRHWEFRGQSHSQSRSQSPVESSSDELAAGSEHEEAERRRTSWNTQKNFTPLRPNPKERRLSESESTDELAVDAEEYWRSSRKHRRTSSPERDRSSQGARSRNDSDAMSDGRVNAADQDHPDRDGLSDRSATPVPSASLPPKPEALNYKQKFVLKGHIRGLAAVQFSPDGSVIASAGADAIVRVWDTATGKLMYTFEGHLAGISTLAWSPDGQWIATGSDDKTIRLWNVNTGRAHTKPFVGHHNYIYAIAFAPKGNILVSGSYDEAVFVWDVRRACILRSLPAHSDPVAGIDVVFDGTLIVSCALDGLVRVWDTHSGQCLRTLVHEDKPPATCVKFSPNGKYILAWTLDGCIRMWNYVESRVVKTFQGHVNTTYSLTGCFGFYGPPGVNYNPPPCFVASGSEDGAILCWDVTSKKVLQRIEGHSDAAICVHAGQLDGKRMLVSCGLDMTVRVWEDCSNEWDPNALDPTLLEADSNTADGGAGPDADGDNAMIDAPVDSSTHTPAGDVTMT